MSFQIGDRIAHPLHGAGVIDRIESRRIGRESREYFVLKLQGSGMVIMVPKNACDEVGVRPIVDADTAYDLLRRIPDMDVSMADNWNKRYRENMQRIKSGDLTELAAVIKALTQRDEIRPLSTGERRMLNQARQILLSEISLSVNCPYDFAEAQLDQCLRKPNKRSVLNR